MRNCVACNKHIRIAELLDCTKCNGRFHYSCVNMPKDYYRTQLHDLQRIWTCPECENLTRPVRNDDTPVRPHTRAALTTTLCGPPTTNTLKKNLITNPSTCKNRKTTKKQELSVDEQNNSISNITGDTLLNDTLAGNGIVMTSSPSNTENKIITTEPIISTQQLSNAETITLEKFSLLLDMKLEKMKSSILQDVKTTIQAEFQNVTNKIQNDVDKNTQTISIAEKKHYADINAINEKIKNIEQEIHNLNNSKKIVLYGLPEEYHETETDLFDRVSRAFHDVMNLNINPYIEEIRRIGKRGYKRPLEIELISKRMTKYIMQNARQFNNTGLAVGHFLDGKTLQERNELRKNLQIARKNGNRAYIKNNKLFIDGKEVENSNHLEITTTTRKELPPINNDTTNTPSPNISKQMMTRRVQNDGKTDFFR